MSGPRSRATTSSSSSSSRASSRRPYTRSRLKRSLQISAPSPTTTSPPSSRSTAQTTASPRGNSDAATGFASLPMLFHGQQQQHVGVSLDGKIDQVYIRAAVDVVLKACLSLSRGLGSGGRAIPDPRDDCQAVCVDLARRVTQPWFLHSAMLDLLGQVPRA